MKLVSKYNKTYYDSERNSIEDDEDKGLPVKIFPEAGEKVTAIQPITMNHDQINWIIKDIQGLIPREKRRRAEERGLKDRKPEKDDLGFESDQE